MAANRVIYLTALAAAIGFYLAADVVWFSWALVFVLLLLPPVSLLFSLPQMLCLRLSLLAPERIEDYEALALRVQVRGLSWLPMPELRLQLRVGTAGMAGYRPYSLRQIPREGGELLLRELPVGLCTCEAAKVRVYDYLGLIRLPKRPPAGVATAVLPQPEQPQRKPDLTLFRSPVLQTLPAGSFSELHDHRPYRDGDNARSIHWKLSQKTDELIVREPVAPVRLRCYLMVEPADTLSALQSELAQLRWLSLWLIRQDIRHSVLWLTQDGQLRREIATEDDVIPMLAEACAAPLTESGASLPAPEADWCYRIRPAEEVLP